MSKNGVRVRKAYRKIMQTFKKNPNFKGPNWTPKTAWELARALTYD